MFSNLFRNTINSYRMSMNRVSSRGMSNESEPVATYSTGMQILHWLSGGCMMSCVGSVLYSQSLPKEQTKNKMEIMHYHKSFGTLSLLLLVPRLAFRLTSKLPAEIPGTVLWEHLAGKASHIAMYGFIIFMPVSGAAMGLFGPKGLPFFSVTIPSVSPELRKQYGYVAKYSYEYHKVAGKALEYFVPLHVGGAFYHVFRGHTIFSRIIPGLASTAAK